MGQIFIFHYRAGIHYLAIMGPISNTSFLAWEAKWIKELTLDQLQKRVTNKKGCRRKHGQWWNVLPLQKPKESTDYILMKSAKVRAMSQLLFFLFNIVLLSWHDSYVRGKPEKIRILCIFCTIWKEQNQIMIEKEQQHKKKGGSSTFKC